MSKENFDFGATSYNPGFDGRDTNKALNESMSDFKYIIKVLEDAGYTSKDAHEKAKNSEKTTLIQAMKGDKFSQKYFESRNINYKNLYESKVAEGKITQRDLDEADENNDYLNPMLYADIENQTDDLRISNAKNHDKENRKKLFEDMKSMFENEDYDTIMEKMKKFKDKF